MTGILGDLLWKAGVEPGSVAPRGNRSDRGAPWGAYPCAGEQQWCVIAIRDDDDWRRLVAAIGSPAWAADPALARAEGRFAAHDAIDGDLGMDADAPSTTSRIICSSTACRVVPSSPARSARGPALSRARLRALDRPADRGPDRVRGSCVKRPARGRGAEAGAAAGEHTREIWNLLRLDDAAIERMIADGALEVPPPSAK